MDKCMHKIKIRENDERKLLLNRLNRIEGQIRGLKKMIEKNAYCTDILIQASAANSAINSFSKELLTTHIKGCVAYDLKNGNEESLEDLLITLKKLMK